MKIPFPFQPEAGWTFLRRTARPETRTRCCCAVLGCLLGLLLPAAANAQQAILEPVGGLANLLGANGVEVVGSRAYLAAGDGGIQIVDVSDPAQPIRLGGYNSPGVAQSVQVVGNFAYVADRELGLQIVDVSNPAAPVRVGTYNTPGLARDVHVVDGIAYVADETFGLQVISVTNPAAPVRLGFLDTPDWALAVQVSGNFAFVGDDTTGLMVIDVSNPAAPVLRSTRLTRDWVTGLQVVGNACYVTTRSGLEVFDVSTPTTPVLRTRILTGMPSDRVSVAGQYLFTNPAGGLAVFDVSDPWSPRQLLMESGGQPTRALQAVGSRLYSVSGDSLWIDDLRLGLPQSVNWSSALTGGTLARNTPIPLDVTSSSGLPVTLQFVGPVAVSANTVTITNVGMVTLVVEQAGDEAFLPLREVRQFNIPSINTTLLGSLDRPGDAADAQIVGNLAFVADRQYGLRVIDVSNPVAPVRVGDYNSPGSAYGVQVVGNFAYLADGSLGLQIVDVSNPATPVRVGTYNTPGLAREVHVVDGIAYVADQTSGLQIISVTNPAAPVRLGFLDTPDWALAVQVSGNFAFVGDDTTGLIVIDVSNPGAPVLRSTTTTPALVTCLQVVGNRCHVGTRQGLHIFDISNPVVPVLLSTTLVEGGVTGLHVVSDRCYVTSNQALILFDVSYPAAPARLSPIRTESFSSYSGVQVVGDLAYVPDRNRGLKILDIAGRLPQSLTLDLPETFVFDGRTLPLGGTSSAGLPLTYSVISGPATLVNNELVVTGIGSVRLRVQGAVNSVYLPATLDRTLRVGLPELRADAAGNGVDVTWASGLTGLFLDGRESLASEHPWRPAALPWQEANGRVRVPVESSPFQFFRLRGYTGEAEPLTLTGWNRDVVLEQPSTRRALPFDNFGAVWFESGLGGRWDGLPTNRTIVSGVTPEVTFQLQPYNGSNTLWLNVNQRTNSLVLATPSAYSRLYVLAHSAGGGANGTLRIHYGDGTSSTPAPFFAPDWWDGSPASPTRRPAIQGLARSSRASSFNYESVPPGFSLHQTDFDLSTGPNAGKVITRLEFVKGAAAEVTGVFAVSGIPIPPSQ